MTYDYDITFEDNLLTGNKMIDEQHKELIERIRNFVFACQDGKSKVNAIKMLDYLDEYTDFHFKEEEYCRKRPNIRIVANIMRNMKSSRKQFRNCMNIFMILRGQRISSANLYIGMWLIGCLVT